MRVPAVEGALSARLPKGMTLLEVMVALAIFALAALALLQSLGQLSRGPAQLTERAWAGWVADNLMVELHLAKSWPEGEWREGESQQARRQWFWRWRAQGTAQPGVKQIEVEVYARPFSPGQRPVSVLKSYGVRP